MPASTPDRTALYRFYDADDRLLYVGITHDIKQRWTQHAVGKAWWHLVTEKRVEWLPSREEALAAEEIATRTEGPIYNAPLHPTKRSFMRTPRYDDSEATECVTDGLREAVKSGKYPAGQRLRPSVIAAEYGMSSTTVGSALYRLYTEKLVEPLGSGYRIPLEGNVPQDSHSRHKVIYQAPDGC